MVKFLKLTTFSRGGIKVNATLIDIYRYENCYIKIYSYRFNEQERQYQLKCSTSLLDIIKLLLNKEDQLQDYDSDKIITVTVDRKTGKAYTRKDINQLLAESLIVLFFSVFFEIMNIVAFMQNRN